MKHFAMLIDFIHALLVILPYLKKSQGVMWEILDRLLQGLRLSARLGQRELLYKTFSSWQAREAEFEAEQERIRREKEKEIARLRTMQEKAQDYQAEQVPSWPRLPWGSPTPLTIPLTNCKTDLKDRDAEGRAACRLPRLESLEGEGVSSPSACGSEDCSGHYVLKVQEKAFGCCVKNFH